MNSRHKYLLFLFWLFMVAGGRAQTSVPDTSNTQSQEQPYGVLEAFTGNPGKAALYSLVLPGAGQIYNKKYWKVPVFLAAEGITISILSQNISNYREWDTGYKQLAAGEISNYRGLTNISTVRRFRDNARQSKDYAWIALIAVHIVASADAFVDRHLIEFDVEDDIGVTLGLAAPYPGLAISFTF